MTTEVPFITYTPEQLIYHKQLDDDELTIEFAKVKAIDPTKNSRSFAGNPIIYHYQMSALIDVKTLRKKNTFKPSIRETFLDPELYKDLWKRMISLNRHGDNRRGFAIVNRLFEAERFNQAVVFFKTATAKYLYHHLKATKVLDVCAGWGGRLLGAYGLGISYVGYDTNTDLKAGYDKLLEKLNDPKLEMRYENSLTAEFPEYDCVLTSPPYYVKELYPHMNTWINENDFYDTFLVPLIAKCIRGCKAGGKVCFNISPEMYDKLVPRFRPCDNEIDLLQSKRLGKDKQDKIYIWNC
jgi:hypothetical protein